MTNEECTDLFRRMLAAGGEERAAIRERLILQYDGVAKEVARRFVSRPTAGGRIGYDDAISEARVALVRAVDYYRVESAAAVFKTYAFRCCHNHMHEYLGWEGGGVSVGRAAGRHLLKVAQARTRLRKAGLPSEDEDVFRSLGWGPDRRAAVEQALRLYRTGGDRTGPDDDAPTWTSLAPDREPSDLPARDLAARAEVRRVMAVLHPSERDAVAMRYGLGRSGQRTYREVGEAMGFSHQRAQQLVTRAFRKMTVAVPS